jgi:WD40 repeat protein
MQDSVYAVAYAHNGKRFASGGADNTVIIWTSKVAKCGMLTVWACTATRKKGTITALSWDL